jgi:hypothetical protein
MVIRIVFVILVFLLVAAHFFRAGNYLFVAAALVVPFLLLIRSRWAAILLQVLTWSATVLWICVAIGLVRQRIALGQPFRGVIVILGCVVLFNILSASLLHSLPSKNRESYPQKK